MEPKRREALIEATIAEVGAVGLVEVTVGRIAKRAGVSVALAFHRSSVQRFQSTLQSPTRP